MNKEKLDAIRKKAKTRQLSEKVEEAKKDLDSEMSDTTYDIFKDKGKYKLAVLRFNPVDMKAYVSDIVDVPDRYKAVAIRTIASKADLKQLILKGRKK